MSFGRVMRMEERIVLDGSVVPLDGGEVGGELAEAAAVDAGAALADGASLEQQNDESEADDNEGDFDGTESAAESGGIESSELRALLVNSNVDQYEAMADALLKDVLVYVYDGSTDSLDEILAGFKEAAGGKAFESIALATHSQGAGTFALGSGEHVSLGSFLGSSEQQEFFAGLGGMIDVDGHLDLLTCNLAGSQDGDLLLASIEDAAGVEIAASDDLTGNAAQGGDWVLERGDADVVSLYFDAGEIGEYESALVAETKLTPATGDYAYAGHSVAIDGDYAVVGAYKVNDYQGAVYVYHDNGSSWQLQATLTADDGAAGDCFGYSVAISGNVVIVGAYGDDDNGDNSGSAYIFDFDDGSWTNDQFKVTANDGIFRDNFGLSVSISGDTAIIGAQSHKFNEGPAARPGSAYIIDNDDGSWINDQIKLTASDGVARDYFGHSVAISGSTAIVGAVYDGDNGDDSGSAYVFDFDDGSWTNDQFKLTASDGAAYDYFGVSVAISGDTAIVGARNSCDYKGSAYVFDFDDGSWINDQTKLTAFDGGSHDFFGYSVAISGNTAIVGAYKDSDSGSAYIFDFADGSWMNDHSKLTASDGSSGDGFGYSVAIFGNTAIVGAIYDDDNGRDSGCAYILNSRNAPVVSNPIADQSTAEDGGFSFQFAADTFTDVDNDISGYTATLASGAALPEWLSFNSSTRTFSGTPENDAVGSINIKVTASDADASVSDYFLLTVTQVNDAPTGSDATLSALEDVAKLLTVGDFGYSDIDVGDGLESVRIESITNGVLELAGSGSLVVGDTVTSADIVAGKLSFTADENLNGDAAADFGFKVYDGEAYAVAANTITLNVTPVNDAPSGGDGTLVTLEDVAKVLTVADFGFSDIDSGDALVSIRIESMTGGVLTLEGSGELLVNDTVSRADIEAGKLSFAPAADLNGDSAVEFTFKVYDGELYSAVANMIDFDVTPVNDAPSGGDSTRVTLEDVAKVLTVADFGYSDTDFGDVLESIRIESLSNGVLTLEGVGELLVNDTVSKADIVDGKLSFTPAADLNGESAAEFTFKVYDGEAYSAAANTIDFDVTPVNDAPNGVGSTLVTLEDIAKELEVNDFGYSDIEGDYFYGIRIDSIRNGVLTLEGVIGALEAGSIVSRADIAAGMLSFLPAHDLNGIAAAGFTFSVSDGELYSTQSEVISFDVTPVDDLPFSTPHNLGKKPLTSHPAQRGLPENDLAQVELVSGMNNLEIGRGLDSIELLVNEQFSSPAELPPQDVDRVSAAFTVVADSESNAVFITFGEQDGENGGVKAFTLYRNDFGINILGSDNRQVSPVVLAEELAASYPELSPAEIIEILSDELIKYSQELNDSIELDEFLKEVEEMLNNSISIVENIRKVV